MEHRSQSEICKAEPLGPHCSQPDELAGKTLPLAGSSPVMAKCRQQRVPLAGPRTPELASADSSQQQVFPSTGRLGGGECPILRTNTNNKHFASIFSSPQQFALCGKLCAVNEEALVLPDQKGTAVPDILCRLGQDAHPTFYS